MSAVVNPFTGRWVMEPKVQNVWGIPHATWFTAMGIGAALFVQRALFGLELGRLLGMPLADLLSMLLIGVGGLILIADLGKPFRLLRALSNPRTSWISVGAICDFLFVGLDGLWTLAELDLGTGRLLGGLPWAGNSPLGLLFQGLAVACCVVIITYPGLVLAASPSMPFWNTTVIPLQFLAYGTASALGLALLSSLWTPVSPSQLQAWARIEVFLLALCALLLVAHLLQGQASHTTSRLSVERLTRGPLAGLFWGGVVLVGLGLPLVGLLTGIPGLVVGAAVLLLVGNWLSKLAIIRAGIYAPFL